MNQSPYTQNLYKSCGYATVDKECSMTTKGDCDVLHRL